MTLSDDLISKFDSFEELSVSEEMLCAYQEGTLGLEDSQFVESMLESDDSLLSLYESVADFDDSFNPFAMPDIINEFGYQEVVATPEIYAYVENFHSENLEFDDSLDDSLNDLFSADDIIGTISNISNNEIFSDSGDIFSDHSESIDTETFNNDIVDDLFT